MITTFDYDSAIYVLYEDQVKASDLLYRSLTKVLQ